MFDWFASTLKQYPEIAIFLALGLGYYFGKFTFRGLGLGRSPPRCWLASVIGQIGITIAQPLKATVFLMFLFAVGYGVGPQFVRGIAKDGVPQALFTVVQCVFSLFVPYAIVKMAGYDLGYAAGFYSGSQTLSAAMGLSTDAINRLGLAAADAKAHDRLDADRLCGHLPVRHRWLGDRDRTVGPRAAAHRSAKSLQGLRREAGGGGAKELGGAGSAWHRWEVRAFRVKPGGRVDGLRAVEAEALVPDARIFVLRVRRNGAIEEGDRGDGLARERYCGGRRQARGAGERHRTGRGRG